MDDKNQPEGRMRPNGKKALGTAGLAMLTGGVGLGLYVLARMGNDRGSISRMTSGGILTVAGVGIAALGGAYDMPRTGAGIGATSFAYGLGTLLEEAKMRFDQAPSHSTARPTTAPGATHPPSSVAAGAALPQGNRQGRSYAPSRPMAAVSPR